MANLYLRPDKGVRIEFLENSVKKFYSYRRNDQFTRELRAYQFFEKINWRYALRLKNYSVSDRWIEIELFRGKSVHELLEKRERFNIEDLMQGIYAIELELANMRVSAEGITTKDVLIDKVGSVRLIDFEETWVGTKPRQSVLYSVFWNLCARWNYHYAGSELKHVLKKSLSGAIFKHLRANPAYILPLLKTLLMCKKRRVHCLIYGKPY